MNATDGGYASKNWNADSSCIFGDDMLVEGSAAMALVVEIAYGREIVIGKAVPRCVTRGRKRGLEVTWVHVLARQ